MKATINSHLPFVSGEYVKSDRSGKTLYPVCVKDQITGKLFWIPTDGIKNVNYSGTNYSASKFISLLRI